jgi:hypothetical protein
MVIFIPTVLEFNDEIKIGYMSPKNNGILSKVCRKKMFYNRNILHMWQGYFVSILLYENIVSFLFYLFDKFNLEACNVCKALMKGSHNLSTNVKMTKNVGRPSCLIITNKLCYNSK